MTTADRLCNDDDMTALRRFAAAGDPRAFEVIADRYRGMVLATCRRVLRHEADAEGAAQETFLKLARKAGTVKSNAAAWLHATAMRTSLDFKRRSGVRDRVERAAQDTRATATGENIRAWRDIEPLIDAALESLSGADRELIVARFLSGRQQADMAREAGVNPGTMHRRIDKALERLRTSLTSRGVGIGCAAALTAALAQAPIPDGSSIAASVGKIGLAGFSTPPIAGAASKLVAAAAIGLLAVGSIGGAYMMNRPRSTLSPAAALAEITGSAVERPTKQSDRLPLAAYIMDYSADSKMRFDGTTMRIVVDFDEGRPLDMVMRVVDRRPGGEDGRARFRVESIDAKQTALPPDIVGTTLDIQYAIEGIGRLTMRTTIDTPAHAEKLIWHGVRVQATKRGQPGFGDALGGVWEEIPTWELRLDPDEIAVLAEEWKIHIFRVLDWQKSGVYTRVQTICTDSMDPRLVGQRVKLLLRAEEEGGYTFVYHSSSGSRLNEWPAGFDVKPGQGLQRMTWREAKP